MKINNRVSNSHSTHALSLFPILNLYKINCRQIRETLIRPVDLVGHLRARCATFCSLFSQISLVMGVPLDLIGQQLTPTRLSTVNIKAKSPKRRKQHFQQCAFIYKQNVCVFLFRIVRYNDKLALITACFLAQLAYIQNTCVRIEDECTKIFAAMPCIHNLICSIYSCPVLWTVRFISL